MSETIDQVRADLQSRLESVADAAGLEQARIEFLGRARGRIPALMQQLASLPKAEKPAFGKAVNELKQLAQSALDDAAARLDASDGGAKTSGPMTDVTLPGRMPWLGRLHPITRARREMIEIFSRLGFTVADGPEIEDEWHNFVALNIPPEHPARDPLDNYYIRDDLLLRSQTSTVQIRVMETTPPPVRVIIPGRVYRPDTIDAGHSNMFHQLEGLWVDHDVTFAHLKACLAMFFHAFLGPEVRTRFRPSFFPFTEPSAEMDISCLLCGGDGCPACKRTGWIELLGCGVVDPNVLEAVGYDPEEVSGFAFGFGIDRLTMMKYGIDDIRLLFQNDLRFLRQF